VACDFQPPLHRLVVPQDNSNLKAWTRLWETLTFRRRNLAADILLKAVDILQTEVCRSQMAAFPPDVLITPKMPQINIEDFRLTEEIIRAGAKEAAAMLGPLNGDD
jgi:predicted acylesterase/phospholipase RssA